MKFLAIFETTSGEHPGSGVGKISTGSLKHFPNTASDGAEPSAACGVEWRDSITHGNFLDQSCSTVDAAKAVFRVLWNLSIIPLASGLYAVTCWSLTPILSMTSCHRSEVKFVPLSVTIDSGKPYLEIHWRTCLRHVSADCVRMGNASVHLVALSMIVRIYLYPSDGGNGPTISRWIWANLFDVGSYGCMPDSTCVDILYVWHWWHSLTHRLMSFLMLSQMYLVVMSFVVEFEEGCETA